VPSTAKMLHEITRIMAFVENMGEVSKFDQYMIKISLQKMTDELKAPRESQKNQFRLIQGGCVQSNGAKAVMRLQTNSEDEKEHVK